METLDRIDRAILNAVSEDGRITVTSLASKVGLSKTPCAIRLKRLEEEGYILGYHGRLDRRRLGSGHVAFVQVSLTDTKSAALDAFNKAAHAIPEIESCHMIAGNFDYLLKVRTADMESYREIHGERISTLPHVSHTSTFVAMETVKDNGI